MEIRPVVITHFTDPTCPWAFAAEPQLRRLEWQLGDAGSWQLRMVGLWSDPAEAAANGVSTKRLTRTYARFAERYGMPFPVEPIARLYSSIPGCLAVVAARRVAPDRAERLLRALRVRHFSGHLVDDPATLALVAADAGIPPGDLRGEMADPACAAALRDDLHAARAPSPAALAQPERLAQADDGLRYTCPSLEFAHASGRTISAPGFQPAESYDLAVANLDPGLVRRAPAGDVRDVLAWAPYPLATAEVAAVCDISRQESERRLAQTALRIPSGTGDYWRLPGT